MTKRSTDIYQTELGHISLKFNFNFDADGRNMLPCPLYLLFAGLKTTVPSIEALPHSEVI